MKNFGTDSRDSMQEVCRRLNLLHVSFMSSSGTQLSHHKTALYFEVSGFMEYFHIWNDGTLFLDFFKKIRKKDASPMK